MMFAERRRSSPPEIGDTYAAANSTSAPQQPGKLRLSGEMGWMMTDNSNVRGDEEPRPSKTEPYVEESALDPAGHHTPAQEEALAEQVQADEEDIERTGYETAERESGQTADAGAKGTPGPGVEKEASARADADIGRRLTKEDDLAAASEAEDADDLDT